MVAFAPLCAAGGDALTSYRMCLQPHGTTLRTARAICSTRFRFGDWWVWQYRDGAGQTSSWERYSVRACEGDEVILEMASKFEVDAPYHAHHRMRVSVAESLGAKESPKQWKLCEFSFERDGAWYEAPHRDNVQAFEEKFNSFLMAPVRPSPVVVLREREHDVPAVGRASLVQSRRHAHTGAWYIREPRRYAGLSAYKVFGREGADTFTFELVAMGSAEGTRDAGPMSSGANGRSGLG